MYVAIRELEDDISSRVTVILCLTLDKREAYRLPPECRGIRVLSSGTWLTVGSKDFLLGKGEEVLFEPDRYGALISAVDENPLLVEIISKDQPPVEHGLGGFRSRLVGILTTAWKGVQRRVWFGSDARGVGKL